ncbi:MAG: hypothetical protein ACI9HA_002384 [Dinoroseobacter sp.]|jgi:hypothetical protein
MIGFSSEGCFWHRRHADSSSAIKIKTQRFCPFAQPEGPKGHTLIPKQPALKKGGAVWGIDQYRLNTLQ